ncbi:MAG: hypothetical protein AAB582_04005 [Patescibacteria group bacterium]
MLQAVPVVGTQVGVVTTGQDVALHCVPTIKGHWSLTEFDGTVAEQAQVPLLVVYCVPVPASPQILVLGEVEHGCPAVGQTGGGTVTVHDCVQPV